MAATRHCRVLIIGSGPAGYTAAIYAARANLQPVLVQGLELGGQLSTTTDVENYPGFAEVIQGPWLMEQMAAQAANCGAELVFDSIVAVDLARRPFRCRTDSGDLFLADSLILATGARARWLGLPSERKFAGHGVSACATCDGFFFRGKPVAVVGGGNTAVEEAIYLSQIASQVVLIHRRDRLRAEKVLQDRLFRNPKVTVLWNRVVEDIVGQDHAAHGHRAAAARRPDRGAERARGRGRVHRDRSRSGDAAGQGSARDGPRRLRRDGAGQHRDQRAGRVRRRRRAGQDLPPGGDRGRQRLHGGARGGEVPRRDRSRCAGARRLRGRGVRRRQP